MPDREKVAKGLHQHCECSLFDRCGECPYYEVADEQFSCRDRLLDNALELLKAQEAVDARKENDGVPQPWTSWWYVCGDCGQEIDYHDRFCRWCGRSVKWDA